MSRLEGKKKAHTHHRRQTKQGKKKKHLAPLMPGTRGLSTLLQITLIRVKTAQSVSDKRSNHT